MPKAKLISVACDNRPGTTARVARVLSEAKVNLLACLVTTSGDEGATKVVVDNPARARKALEAARFSYAETDVIRVELPHRRGALAEYAGKLAAKGINIISAFVTSSKGARRVGLVLVVSDPDQAARIR
jgi:hypothetical protein